MFFLLFACAQTDTELVETTEPAASLCDITIDATDPVDGQYDHYVRDPLRFTFSEVAPNAVVDAGVSGTQHWEGTTLVFTPDEPLFPDWDYDVTVDYCHGAPSIEFGTSSLGQPVYEEAVGNTYAIDFSEGRFLNGDVGQLLAEFFGRYLLVQLRGWDADGLDLRVGVSEYHDEAQELCRGTLDLYDIPIDGSWFAYDVDEFQFGASGNEVTFLDFEVDGTLAEDASHVGGVRFAVTLIVDELVPVLGVGDEDQLCQVADQLGVVCEPCDDGQCVTIAADRISAELVDEGLEHVDPEDVPAYCEG